LWCGGHDLFLIVWLKSLESQLLYQYGTSQASTTQQDTTR
jgi:hypothetical protein